MLATLCSVLAVSNPPATAKFTVAGMTVALSQDQTVSSLTDTSFNFVPARAGNDALGKKTCLLSCLHLSSQSGL